MKTVPCRSALYLALYYGTNAVYQGYMSKFYQQNDISGHRLMLLLVSFPLFAAAFQPFWGIYGDRRKTRNTALKLCIALSGLILSLAAIFRNYQALLVISCAFASVYPAVQPLGDSIVLEALERERAPYGPVRLKGTLAFAFSNLIFGFLLKNTYQSVPLIVCAGLILLFAGAFLLPKVPGHQHARGKASFFALFKCPHLIPYLALTMVLQAALGYFFSYFSLHFTALPGGTSSLLGLGYFIASMSEVPFLLLGDRLYRRLGTGKLLLLAALVQALRFLLIGLSSNVYVLLASQLLHGLSFVVITFSMAKFISLHVPETLRASGQMLLSIAGAGVARVIGIAVGGVLSASVFGPKAGFLLFGVISALSFVIFIPIFLITSSMKIENSR